MLTMPYFIVHRGGGEKPWKIMKNEGGKIIQIGSSDSKKDAEASIRARYMSE